MKFLYLTRPFLPVPGSEHERGSADHQDGQNRVPEFSDKNSNQTE